MPAHRALLVGICGIGLCGCWAAPRNERPPQPFLEQFSVYPGKTQAPRDTSLLFEADAAAQVLLVDQLVDAYDHISQNDTTSNTARAWRVILSPMFIIRQLNDSSAAVRTPSFMPRISAEHMWVSRRGQVTAAPVVSFPRVRILGLRGSLAHHSNGQAGCFRRGFVPINARSNDCRYDGFTDTTVVRLNRANGDFSSTYFELLGYSKWMDRGSTNQPTWTTGFALAGDWYAPFLFGALSDEQQSLYGSWRLRALTQAMWKPQWATECGDPGPQSRWCAFAGRTRLDAEYVRAPDLSNDLARRIQPQVIPYRWSVQLSQSIDRLLGAGPSLKYIDGQDYYNIGFVNRRRAFMFGITLDASGPDRIRKKAKSP
jgi:hypothetical protein